MKRALLLAIGVAAILVLAVLLLTTQRAHRSTKAEYASAVAAEDSIRGRYEAAVEAIVQIQDSLTAILPSESQVLDLSRDIETDSPVTRTRKDQVLTTIADLNASIESSKRMIRRLESRLKESGVRIEGLERLLTNLKETVARREATIRTLAGRVDSLKVRVTVLEGDVAEGQRRIEGQAQVIEEKNKELSTIYYVVGMRKDLKRLGLIRETGGLIGLGRSSRVSGDINPAVFTPVDTDRRTVIQVPGKEPEVLTGQNKASYALVPISKQWHELHITQPREFRKVRYLVIETH